MPDIELIETASELENLCGTLEQAELVALDTEFVRESTYFAELCLIQLATDKRIVCIDCCAGLDTGPLFRQLFNPRIRLVAHSGRQDIEVLQQAAGFLPPRLIDTQIAAGLLGHPPQVGLRELLIARLDVEIEKSMARTDWRRRPLSPSALHYAATDVEFLLPLWRLLAESLEDNNRTDWFEEDCARALDVELEPGLSALYQRTRGTGRLRDTHAAAALALLAWREARARVANRPRRWILKDEIIVELARRLPSSKADLGKIETLAPKTIHRFGKDLLAAIAQADDQKFRSLAEDCAPAPRPDTDSLKAMQKRVTALAKSLGIESEIIATRRDMVATVLESPPAHIAAGWRSQVLASAA